MRRWFLGQSDYIFFIYGLACIGLGIVSYLLSRDIKQRLAWIWLALFGLTHGVRAWLDLLAPIWQEALWLKACRWGLLAASFLALAEFGRLGLVRQRGRGPGRWLLGIIALLGCLGALSGWNGLSATTRYMGLIAGLSAGLALYRAGHQNNPPGRTWLIGGGISLILYALAIGPVIHPASFLPATVLNFQSFTDLSCLPVWLPQVVLAVVIIAITLGYLRATWPTDPSKSRRHRIRYMYGIVTALVIILVLGWRLTQFLGNLAQEQIRKDTICRGNLIIQGLTFEMEEAEAAARAMSGSPWLIPALVSKSPRTLAQANSVLDRYQSRFGASPAYILDRTGTTVTSSNRESQKNFSSHNFAFRPYFQEAIRGLPGRYFAVGSITKKPGFFAAYPVLAGGGKIVGVAAIKTPLDKFQQELRESDPAFLLDPHGIIFLSSRPGPDPQSLWPVIMIVADVEKSQFGASDFKPVFPQFQTDGAEVTMAGQTYLFFRQYINTPAAPAWSLVLLTPNNMLVFYRLVGVAATFIMILFTLLAAGSNLFIREGASRIVASEARFRAMFDAAPEAVFVFDAETRKILDANPFMAQWLGYSREELLNLKVDQLLAVHPLNEEARWQGSVGLKPTSRHRYRQKDGSLVDVEGTAAKLLYGDQVRELVFVRDITERRRVEADLQTSLRFLEIVHHNTEIKPLLKAFVEEIKAYTGCEAVGIRVLDAAGGIPYLAYEGFSKRFYEQENPLSSKSDRCMCINVINGQTDPALPFYTQGGSFYLNGASRFLATVSEADKGKTRNVCNQEGYESVALIPFRRGERILGLIHVADRQENMAPLHMVKMLEQAGMQLGSAFMRIRAEEALRESEEKYRGLIETTTTGYVIVDTEGKVLDANQEYVRLTGSNEIKEILGRSVIEWTAEEDRGKNAAAIEQCLQTGLVKHLELDYIGKDGRSIPVEINATAICTSKGVKFVSLVRDISERKQAEAEKAILTAQLVQAQKIEAIGTLAGGIAHDFNNLLTGIMGNISLAMLDQQENSTSRDTLTAAEEACLQAQSLAAQLLTFAKGGAPIKEPISFEKLITETACLAVMGSQVRCEFDLPDNLWAAQADRGQISQAFQNLITNAIQAMPAGGTIKVRGENLEIGRKGEIPLSVGRYIAIVVQDQGTGIPQNYLPKIFDPYFTTKPGGSGLGLTTVYSIVKNHGGHIAVESSSGGGTVVQVFLPAVTPEIIERPEENRQVLSGQMQVLVMDDEEIVRVLLDKMLNHLGYRATLAKDGAEALELFIAAREARENFAAVILDLTVPGGMGGKATLEEFLRIDPQVKAIVSSGYSDDPIMAEFAQNGFSGVITKPYRIAELSRVLNQVLTNHTAITA